MSGDPHADKLIQDINKLIKDISGLGLQSMLDTSYEQIVEALRYLPKRERQPLVVRAMRRVEEIDAQVLVAETIANDHQTSVGLG
jgi:hypothetical protein